MLHPHNERGAATMSHVPTEDRFTGSKDVEIFYRAWTPAAAPRAVVVLCHGVNAHGGQYLWAGEQLEARGFAVFALDLRGRGRSGGRRFHVDDVADYASDVGGTIAIAKQRFPGLPVFLLGHSAGGVTSAIYTLDHQAELAGFICESFAFQVPAPGFALTLIKWLSGLFPHLPVLKLKMRDFSRDPATVAALEADPLTKDEAQPAITVAALTRANARLRREFQRITLPLLILHGTADKVTLPGGSVFFDQNAGSSDKTLKLYQEHVHDLLADTGKQDVLDDVVSWIEARLPA